jgi:hypothetical protein
MNWRPTNIDENDLVITVLFSSAAGRQIVSEASFSSSWPGAQVMARDAMLLDRKYSVALRTSEEVPDLEIRTG